MDLTRFYPARHEDARKGEFGRVLVVGGSHRYTGAPAFNALAALRAGADVVHVLAPRRAADVVASFAPDLIATPSGDAFPDPEDALKAAAAADALVVGGGVERGDGAHTMLRRVVTACGKPVVADAEALHALAGATGLDRRRVLLTPNGGEFEILAGAPWPKDAEARKAAARDLARQTGATVVVKGRFDVVSDGERVHVDEAGSPYLTKGGHGDLLAGAAGALLARGHDAFDAASAAAFVVGRAGALAAAALGESTTASDVLAHLHRVLPRLT